MKFHYIKGIQFHTALIINSILAKQSEIYVTKSMQKARLLVLKAGKSNNCSDYRISER